MPTSHARTLPAEQQFNPRNRQHSQMPPRPFTLSALESHHRHAVQAFEISPMAQGFLFRPEPLARASAITHTPSFTARARRFQYESRAQRLTETGALARVAGKTRRDQVCSAQATSGPRDYVISRCLPGVVTLGIAHSTAQLHAAIRTYPPSPVTDPMQVLMAVTHRPRLSNLTPRHSRVRLAP